MNRSGYATIIGLFKLCCGCFMFQVKALGTNDRGKVQDYLSPHKISCMFLCHNLQHSGIGYQNAPFHGDYWGCFNGNTQQVCGVMAHYWNGNVMMFADSQSALQALVQTVKVQVTRPIAGVLGPSEQAQYVIKAFGLQQAAFNVNRAEGLYALVLSDLQLIDIPSTFDVVSASQVANEIIVNWMTDYHHEALGAPRDEHLQQRATAHANLLSQKDAWVLLKKGEPVSLSAFNARVGDTVQVGPVWTPPASRNQGYARMLLATVLLQQRDLGIKQACLFTDNPAAAQVYTAIGFKHVGEYQLALLRD